MADLSGVDHYEVLQVSPRADRETIQRVFRYLAKRYHPDNRDSGDPDRFKQLLEAGEAPTTKGQPRGRQSILNYD